MTHKPGLWTVYHAIDLPLVPVLLDMERTGVRIDQDRLGPLGEEIRAEAEAHRLAAMALAESAGVPHLNLGSTPQVRHLVYDVLGLPITKQTKTSGLPSVDKDVLRPFRSVPFVDHLLSYREMQKLYSTYVAGLGKAIASDGRVHPSWNNTRVETGRLSSSDPNCQNIPSRSRVGKLIRTAFVASPGNVIVKMDQSQIELRIVAVVAGETKMIEAFRTGKDLHQATADLIGIPRAQAKIVNFGGFAEVKPTQLLEAPRGNQQPGRAGTSANGSETDSVARPVTAAARERNTVGTSQDVKV